MTSLLNSIITDSKKLQQYINICNKKLSIDVVPPHINKSLEGFSVDDSGKKIVFGLKGIKGVGKLSSQIVEERLKNGEFTSVFNFVERVDGVAKGTFESLVKAGALDGFGYNRRELLESSEMIVKAVRKMPKNQINLFDYLEEAEKFKYPAIPKMNDYSKKALMDYEYEYLGIYVSGHPLDGYEDIMDACGCTSIFDIEDNVRNGKYIGQRNTVTIGGFFSRVNKKLTKKGDPFAFIDIQDFTSQKEALAWNQALEKAPELYIASQDPLLIKADLQVDDGGTYSLFIKDVYLIPKDQSEQDAFLKEHGVKRKIKRIKDTDRQEGAGNYSHTEAYFYCLTRNQIENLIDKIKKSFPGTTKSVFIYTDTMTKKQERLILPNCSVNIKSQKLEQFLKDENIKMEVKRIDKKDIIQNRGVQNSNDATSKNIDNKDKNYLGKDFDLF